MRLLVTQVHYSALGSKMILSKSTSKNYYPGRILSENLSETDQRRNLLENCPGHGSPYGDRNFTNQGCHMATGRISTQVADSGHRMATTMTSVWVAIWRPARSFPGSPYGEHGQTTLQKFFFLEVSVALSLVST